MSGDIGNQYQKMEVMIWSKLRICDASISLILLV